MERSFERCPPLQIHVARLNTASSPTQLPWSKSPSFASVPEEKIVQLRNQSIHQLTLSDLVKYGILSSTTSTILLITSTFSHGRPPLSANALLSSANFTSSLIPVRLAHRVHALRNLPFIVASNPNISRIYGNYLHSLETLTPFHNREFTDIKEEIEFTDALADLVETHAKTIPVLARGFLECRKYISPESVTRFLDEHLRARIGTRLIAEQHIALHVSSQPHSDKSPPSGADRSYIGVIDTTLRPATVLSICEAFVSELCELKYGVRPSLVVNGSPDTTIAHIPMHLEYILTELLKNAFRATVESGHEREPVEVTIAVSKGGREDEMPRNIDLDGANDGKIGGGACGPGDETLTIRIRDRGGGIAPEHLPHIWRYSFTTFRDDLPASAAPPAYGTDALNVISSSGGDTSTIAGLGYGLPLSRAYAEYFGGGIKLESLWGWGTDVYLTLKGLRGIEKSEVC